MGKIITVKQAKWDALLPDFRRFAAGKRLAAIQAKRSVIYKSTTCVQYDGTYLNATDCHRAIRIKSEYVELPQADTFLYCVRDDEYKTLNYPEMNRLYPTEFQSEIFIPYDRLKELRKALNIIHEYAKQRDIKNNTTLFEATNDGIIRLSTWKSDVSETIGGFQVSGLESVKFYVNSGYLKDALITANKLKRYTGTSGIYLKLNGRMRPVVITDNAMYEMLVLPIRTY